ncbi:aldose 1-epimerase family protein [Methylosinus sp. H3A]|uniref:aldose 1-epimerase family protein n=1 Tax=Methylosinus sp. H3A TaxID=2785786 RepID=UPI0018C31590|nr:aldose 1-epimerase family protein [Methylosinus sp. H3A]MBG0812197.1 aldose 1-epimerase family protein [Methylosinus sp. H3A]
MAEPKTDQREGVTLSSDSLTAFVSPKGAELQSLRDSDGVNYLWGGEPIWPKHSPLLFPIVGRLANDRFDYRGESYAMPKHGFARDSLFEIIGTSPNFARFSLRSNAATRAAFPFDFLLEVEFTLSDRRLDIRHGVTNLGVDDMHFSIGAHPAFRWPLGDAAKQQSKIRFERDEPAPVRRLVGGLVGRTEPSPVENDTLSLRETLFADDAIIFDALESRRLVYSCGSGRSVEVGWTGFAHLGLWSKPGADFLCIEPWRGYDSPIEFAGEFDQKPGIAHARPGETLDFTLSIQVA